MRVYVEDSPEAQKLLDQMRQIREAARETVFTRPLDLQFSEAPKSGLSRFSRLVGGWVLGVWLASFVAYGVWELIQDEGPWLAKLLVFGVFSGLALLLLSALLDRLRVAKDDPYTGVER